MGLPAGLEYTTTLHGTEWKRVSCEYCPEDFAYRVSASAIGIGESFLFLDNGAAKDRSAAEASRALSEKLAREVRAIACPRCGKYQPDMLELARATLLLIAGRRDEGVASLQSWLETNPKSPDYKRVEQRVETLMGVGSRALADASALARCEASGEQLNREIRRLFDGDGVKAVIEAVAKLGPKCSPNANAVEAWTAALRGDCASASLFAAKAGGEDVSGVKSVCEPR